MTGPDAVTATPAVVAGGGPAAAPAADRQYGLGVSLPPADALAKAQGTFPYAADLWAEGLLWASVLRSPHPRARIVSIDTSAAEDMPGVRAVVTHRDVPGEAAVGRRVADRPVFAHDMVRHHGEPIAAVAADHPDTARLAAAAIAVEYEVLEPVTDPETAFEAEPLHPDGNLIRHIPLAFGDASVVGEVIVEGAYRIGRQDPAPIGAEAGLAVPRSDGGVELYMASTDPHADRDMAVPFPLRQQVDPIARIDGFAGVELDGVVAEFPAEVPREDFDGDLHRPGGGLIDWVDEDAARKAQAAEDCDLRATALRRRPGRRDRLAADLRALDVEPAVGNDVARVRHAGVSCMRCLGRRP